MASAVHIRESIQALDKEFAIHDVRLLGVVSRTIFTAALIRNGGHTQQSDMLADQFMIDSDTSDFVDYRAFMNYLDDLAEEVGRMGSTPTAQPNASPQVASTTLPTASRSPSTSQPAAILSQPVKQDEQHGSLTQRRPSPSPTPSSTASRVSIAVAERLKSGSSSQYIDVEASCSPATPVPPAGGRGASREAQHNEPCAMNDAQQGTYHRMLYHNADIELAETVSKVEDSQRGGPSPPPRPVTLPGFDGPMAAMTAPTAILSQSPSSPFANTVALSSVGSGHISQVTQIGIAAATAAPTVISNPQPAPPSNEATPKRAQSDYKSTRMLEDSPTYAISELSATPTPIRPQPPGETLLEAQRRLEYTASYFVPSDGANAMSSSPAIHNSTRARSRDGLAAPDQLYAYLAKSAATSYAAGQSHQPAPPAQDLNTSWRASTIRPEVGGSESRKQLATTYPSENYFYVPPTVEDERPHESMRPPPTLCPADRSILDPSRADSRLLYNTAIERFWSDEKAIRPIQEVYAEQPSPSLVVMSPTKSVSPQLRAAIATPLSPKIGKLPLETVFDIIASSSLSTNNNNSTARSTVTLPVVHRCLHSERAIPHTSFDELAAVVSSLGLGEEEPLGLSDFCMFVSRLRPEAIAGLRDPRNWQLRELAKPLITAPQQGRQAPFEARSPTRPAHESLLQSVSSPTLLESTVTGRQLQGQLHAASDLWASSATNDRSPSAPSPARSAPPKPLLDSHKLTPHSEKPYPLQPTNSSWSEGISDLDGHDGLQAQGSGTQWVVDRPEDFHSYQHSQGTSSIRRAERNNALAALAGMVEQDTIQTGRHASRSRSMEIVSARSSQSPDSYFMMPSSEPHVGPTKVMRRFKRVSGDDPSARNRSHSSHARAVELRPQVAIRNPKPRPDTTALGQDKMTGQAVVPSSSRLLKPTESFRQRTRSAIEDKQPTGAATISRRVVDTVPLHGLHANRFSNPTAVASTFNVPIKTSSRIEAETSALKVAGALCDTNAASTNTVQRSGLVNSFSSDPPHVNQPSTEVVHLHYHDPVATKGYAAGQMRLPAQATIRERSSLQSKTDVADGGGRKAAAPPQRFLGDIPVNTIDLTNGSSLHPSGSRSKASAATTSMSASRSRHPSPSPRAPAGTNISSVRGLFDGQKGVVSVPIKREELSSASVKPKGQSISIPIQGPISLSQVDKGRSPVPSDDTITAMCGTLLSLCSANDPRQLGEVGLRAFNTALHSAVSEMSAPDYQKDQLLEWLVDSVRDYIVVSSDPHASSPSAISSPAQQASCRYLEYLSFVVSSWPSQAQILFAAHVEASKSQKGVERQKIDNRARKAEIKGQQRHQLHSNTVADARATIVGQAQMDSSLAEATAKMHKLIRLELSSALGAGTSGREGLALLGATLTDAFTRNDVSRSGYADEKAFRRVLLGLYLPRGSATDPPASNMPSWVMDRCVKIAKEPFTNLSATEALPSSLLKMAYLAAVKAEEEGRVPHDKRHSTCDYRYFMRVLRL